MASNINDTGVNSNYPVAGQDNDSQGFRDNFTVISSNFVAAKAEIEALQTNSAVKNADNNFLGNSIINADFKNTTETAYVAGSTVNTSQNINLDNGAYQEFTVGADITLTSANWSRTNNRGSPKKVIGTTSPILGMSFPNPTPHHFLNSNCSFSILKIS